MKLRRSRRPGFTLLELLLASIIAAMLLYALYFLMNITLRQTSDARDAIEIDAVSRGTFNRMSIDLSAVLAPLPPKSGGNFTSTDSAAQTPTSTNTSTTTTTDASTATDETTALQNNPLQAGLIGEADWFIIYVSRVPAPLTSPTAMMKATDPSSGMPLHDLCFIAYWKGENGGLCRQVRPLVTADGVLNATGPDRSNEAADTIVEEVKELTFEYLLIDTDGSPSWQSTWNGSTLGADNATPQGPPRAVRVTLKYQFPAGPNNPAIEKTVVQVIPIRSGPGPITPTPIDPATDTGATTDTSGMNTGNTNSGNTNSGNSGGSQPSSGGSGGAQPSSGGGAQPSSGGAKTVSSGGGGGTAQPASSGAGASQPSTSGGGKSGGGR